MTIKLCSINHLHCFHNIFIVFIYRVNDKKKNVIIFSLDYNIAMCKCCRRIKKIGPIYKRLVTIVGSYFVFLRQIHDTYISWHPKNIWNWLILKFICICLQFNIIIIILCLLCNLCKCLFANFVTFNIDVSRVQWSSHSFPLEIPESNHKISNKIDEVIDMSPFIQTLDPKNKYGSQFLCDIQQSFCN